MSLPAIVVDEAGNDSEAWIGVPNLPQDRVQEKDVTIRKEDFLLTVYYDERTVEYTFTYTGPDQQTALKQNSDYSLIDSDRLVELVKQEVSSRQ